MTRLWGSLFETPPLVPVYADVVDLAIEEEEPDKDDLASDDEIDNVEVEG